MSDPARDIDNLAVLLLGLSLLEDDYLGGLGSRGGGKIAFHRRLHRLMLSMPEDPPLVGAAGRQPRPCEHGPLLFAQACPGGHRLDALLDAQLVKARQTRRLFHRLLREFQRTRAGPGPSHDIDSGQNRAKACATLDTGPRKSCG